MTVPAATLASTTNITSATGITVATNSDKTGYSLTQALPPNFSSLAISAGGIVQADLQTIKTQSVTCSGGVTIPAATLASTTNITSATGITVSTNSDKTGYSLTQSFPANFSSLSINSSGQIIHDLTQAVPLSNTANTVGDALNAARAQGFGPWTINSGAKTLTMYANDGSTVVHTHNLDSVTSPTLRN